MAIFNEASWLLRLFAKIKFSRKFQNLQYMQVQQDKRLTINIFQNIGCFVFFLTEVIFCLVKNNSHIQIEKWQSEALREILRNDVFWVSLITSCHFLIEAITYQKSN